MLPIGAHVKREDPLAVAEATGSACIQLFLSDPQSFKKPEPHPHAEALQQASIPVYVHAPYLINVASPVNKIRVPSRKILQQTMDAAATVGATAVIVHGGHVGKDDDVEHGVDRWRKAVEQLETDVPLFLENTAGGDNAMARHFDTIARVWDAIGPLGVGFCLDTCHTHAAGETVIDSADRIMAITGRIDLLHCNDSKDDFGSGRDRHEHIGQGSIDPEAILEVVRKADAPVICETSLDGVEDDISFLRAKL
jgi:deoxyribonuclease IV